ncbi:MAG TPA: hypothetical protein VN615_09485 [Gaiellales bacterium]|jgi:uncharacterized membrane protein|nr:hypothetical protein [Gaiellales bacterium]
MTQDRIPRENARETERQADTSETTAATAAKNTGRALLWVLIAVAIVVVIVGVFLLGPFGLFILVPAVLMIWFVSGLAAGGPATGA